MRKAGLDLPDLEEFSINSPKAFKRTAEYSNLAELERVKELDKEDEANDQLVEDQETDGEARTGNEVVGEVQDSKVDEIQINDAKFDSTLVGTYNVGTTRALVDANQIGVAKTGAAKIDSPQIVVAKVGAAKANEMQHVEGQVQIGFIKEEKINNGLKINGQNVVKEKSVQKKDIKDQSKKPRNEL
jgi:hypothetical protein